MYRSTPIALAILAVGVLHAMQTTPQESTQQIRTNKLELIDSKGKVRARLALDDKDNPIFVMMDPDEQPRCEIKSDGNGSTTLVIGNLKKNAVKMGLLDGQPMFGLALDGIARVVAGVPKDGKAALMFTDSKGKAGIMLRCKNEGESEMAVGQAKSAQIYLGSEGGQARCFLAAPDGRQRIELSATASLRTIRFQDANDKEKVDISDADKRSLVRVTGKPGANKGAIIHSDKEGDSGFACWNSHADIPDFTVWTDKDGPQMSFLISGTKRISIAASPDATLNSGLLLNDSNGKRRAALTCKGTEAAALKLFDKDEKKSWQTPE